MNVYIIWSYILIPTVELKDQHSRIRDGMRPALAGGCEHIATRIVRSLGSCEDIATSLGCA